MATATTSSWNPTAQDIIDLALMDVGAFGPGESPDPALRAVAMTLLNLLMKRSGVLGALLWRVVRRTQALISGQASYVLGNDVDDLDDPGRYTAAGATSASQVTVIARDQYMVLPDRTLFGTPMQYYCEKALDASGLEQITLYLYPVPPNTGDTFEYAAVLRAKDITALNQTLDVPQKWLMAVRYGLASALGEPFGAQPGRLSRLNKRFEDETERALNDDNERGGIQAVPFGTSYSYGTMSSNSRYR